MSEKTEVIESSNVSLFPEEIQADLQTNGRWRFHLKKHAKDTIEDICNSFEKNGQLEDIGVRQDEEGNYHAIFGFNRLEAALLHNKKFPKKKMRLSCKVFSDVDDEKALILNMEENLRRKNLSPMDLADNHEKLRESFQWNDAKIARHFNISDSYVNQLKALLKEDPDIQEEVHNGTMSLAALKVANKAGLSDKERKEVLKKFKEKAAETPVEEGKDRTKRGAKKGITETQAREIVRKKQTQEQKEKAPIPRRIPQLYKLLDVLVEKDKPAEVRRIGKLIRRFMEGRDDPEVTENKLVAMFTGEGAEGEEEAPAPKKKIKSKVQEAA